MAYKPGLTFWSDGADKQRYLYIPPGTKIDTSSMDSWKFPTGTKAWKEFRIGGKLVETRLYWKRAEKNWEHATYIWDASGKNAAINESKTATLLDSGYEIPSSIKVCEKCHGGAADDLLGIEPISLALPTAQGVTLASLAAAGLLSHPPAKTTIALPEDATGKAAAALGYLHVNCGACHSSRGISGFTNFHARLRAEQFWAADGTDPGAVAVDSTDVYTTAVGQDVLLEMYRGPFPGLEMIAPGSHDKSLVWVVAHLRDREYQMPPIVSHQIDEAGTRLLADWIDALGK
jgi:mono/diheme cytochrome c family protein